MPGSQNAPNCTRVRTPKTRAVPGKPAQNAEMRTIFTGDIRTVRARSRSPLSPAGQAFREGASAKRFRAVPGKSTFGLFAAGFPFTACPGPACAITTQNTFPRSSFSISYFLLPISSHRRGLQSTVE
jgi:hypothetical protein